MPLPQPQPHDPALSADIRAISDAIEVLQGQVAAITTMVGSGASHAGGLVPDTPVSSGITKFLREDGTWAVPGSAPSPGTGTPPTPVLEVVGGTTGYVTHAVIAKSIASTAGDSAITSYDFNWGDGAHSQATKLIGGSPVPVSFAYHRYTVAGVYTLTLSVTDANANVVTDTETITVTARPAVTDTVNPGGDVIAVLNNAIAGAVVQINAGTYSASTRWTPKNNQIVFANGAVTITGGGTKDYGTLFTTATGVVVQGIRWTAFTAYAHQFGASGGSGASAVFSDCEMDTNGTNGVVSGAVNGYHAGTIKLDNCHIHDNLSYGVASGAQSTVYIIGGEYDNNFTDTSATINPNAGDGVHKHVHSKNDYVVGAHVHDNKGVGLWWDGYNINVYAALNNIHDNYGMGMFIEINDAAVGGPNDNEAGNLDGSGFSFRFLFNDFEGNGLPATSFFPTGNIYPANLYVSKSDKIEFAYNWVQRGSHAVCLDYQVGRAAGHNLANISIHDNDILLDERPPVVDGREIGRVGFHNSVAGTAYSLTNIVINDNHYFAAHDDSTWTHFLTYAGTTETPRTFAAWKGFGYDADSTWALDTAWPH